MIVLINLDSIIKLFGGDFEELVKVYIVNEYKEFDFESNMTTNNFLT